MRDLIQEKRKINTNLAKLKKQVKTYAEETYQFNERFDNMIIAYLIKHIKEDINLSDLHKHIPLDKLDSLIIHTCGSSSPADFVHPDILIPSIKNSVKNKKSLGEQGMYNAYFSIFNDGGDIIVYHRDIDFGDSDDIRSVSVGKSKNGLIEIGTTYRMISNSTGRPVSGTEYYNFIVNEEKLNKFLNSKAKAFKAPNAPVPYPFM